MVHMANRPRLYDAILRDHLQRHRQMALISGPFEPTDCFLTKHPVVVSAKTLLRQLL